MRYRYKNIRQLTAATLLALFVSAAVGCAGSSDEPALPADDDQVELSFATGQRRVSTRATFDDGTPLKLFIYQHPQGGGPVNLAANPYRTVEGVTDGTAAGLSTVRLTGGNLNAEGKLLVSSGRKYDIVVVVDAALNAQHAGIGNPAAGTIAGFTHGQDILAARQEVDVPYGMRTFDVTFNSNGADAAGNLPHLGSAIALDAKVTEGLLTDQSGNVWVRAEGIDFNACLPESAGLNLETISYTLTGSGASHSINYTNPAELLDNTTAVAASGDAVILPCPIQEGGSQNVLDMTFRLSAAGDAVKINAPTVNVPEFRPGYRYKFVVEIDEVVQGVATGSLSLTIGPWDDTAWTGEMGGNPNEDFMTIKLGSWSTTLWTGEMGGNPNEDFINIGTETWESHDWSAEIGDGEDV